MNQPPRWFSVLSVALLCLGLAACSKPGDSGTFSRTIISTEPLADGPLLSEAEQADFESLKPTGSVGFVASAALPVYKIPPPKQGGRNVYKVPISADLEVAYAAYVIGDGEAALEALERAARADAIDPRSAWFLSAFRAQVLIMMGQAGDAEAELERAGGLERKAYGADIITRSLRGDAKLWLGDYAGAATDYSRVIMRTRNFRFPMIYGRDPGNLYEMFRVMTGQLRAYTGLATVHMLEGDFDQAFAWAKQAEAYFSMFHYVTTQHPLYRNRVPPLEPDSFHDRARNMLVLAATILIVKKDLERAEELFKDAGAFFDVVGYAAGKVMVAAFRAQAFLKAGFLDEAAAAAAEAVALATKSNLPDFIWRVEGLHGEALLASGKKAEAEASFRRAQAAIDVVSGSLASDRAKRRFGVGKSDITLRLANLDAERGDYAALFRDLERGRARAFVDMLADRTVASGRESETVAAIRSLDRKIRHLRLLNATQESEKQAENIAAEKALLERRRELLGELTLRDPELVDVLLVSTRELADVQARLGEDEAMAYALPVEAGGRLRFLVIHRESTEILELEVSPAEFRTLLEDFYDAVVLEDPDGQRGAAKALKAALAVPKWGAAKAAYVVPSGDLFFTPWGALEVDFPVAVLPTGGWLARKPKGISAHGRAVVVGDPDFHGALPQLPGARREAAAVARLYGIPALTGSEATVAALRRAVGSGVEVLHLATHGEFDAGDPLNSSLMFSSADGAEALTAARLFEDPLPARLVVLSACRTGGGRAEAGDDFLGLARSFYLAGARAVVNSLWLIDDEGTRIFMDAFHAGAAHGDLGEAWLAARDRLRAEGFPPAVYGAFVLGGAIRE